MYSAERLEKPNSLSGEIVEFTGPFHSLRPIVAETSRSPQAKTGIMLQFSRGPFGSLSTPENPRPAAPFLWRGRNTITPGEIAEVERNTHPWLIG